MHDIMPKSLAPIVLVLILFGCFQSDIGTDIPNELTGTLYLQNGNPAVNAEVTAYAVNYLPGDTDSGYSNVKWTVRTDSNGRFSFYNLSSGQYNLLGKIATPVSSKTGKKFLTVSNDSLFYFLDSIAVSNKRELSPDTLRPPGSLTGKVLLQPDDDSRTTTIQIPGTDYHCNVDSSGTFTLTHLGQGKYRLRAITSLSNYSQLFKEINCRSGRNDTLPGPLFPRCSAARNHFPLDSSTVALWTFNSHANGTFRDWSANGFSLSNANNFALTASPFDSAALFTDSATLSASYLSHANTNALTMAGTGKITYEVRMFLKPGQSGAGNLGGWVIGTYDGVSLQIGADGHFQAAGQKVRNGTNYWIAEGSTPGIVPLNRWVDLAVAFDRSTGQSYGYIDGAPVQLYRSVTTNPITDPFRISNGSFFVGNNGTDLDYQFSGMIDEIRVSNNLVLGAGLPLIDGPPPVQTHFSVNSSTVALWTFSTHTGNTFMDLGPDGFSLSNANNFALTASPYDSAIVFNGPGQYLSTANSVLLTVGGTGEITYEARIYLDQYSPSSNFNGEFSLVGMYEGLKMQIDTAGRLQAAAQKLDSSGTGYWYPPSSDPGVVPLHRWVDVAVALDQTTGEAYGYIDGVPIQLHGDSTNTDLWRVSTSILTVGEDSRDNQQFTGKIDEIRVSNNLVLGKGLTLKP
jgi:hypothetical protein